MDLSDFETLTKRLIKQRIRIAIARQSPIEGTTEAFELFEADLRAKYEKELEKLKPLTPGLQDKLSQIVHDAFIEATREARADFGHEEMVMRGLAEFTETFQPESLLPSQVFA